MKKTFQITVLAFTFFALSIILINGCNNQKQAPDDRVLANEDSVRAHYIDIKTAREYTQNFRDERARLDSVTGKGYLNQQFNLANAESLNRDVFAYLLEQKDAEGGLAAGIRIYHGRKYNDALKRYEVTMVMVPYDKKGNDIILKPLSSQKTSLKIPGISSSYAYWQLGFAIDNTSRCPDVCDGGGSGLNNPGGGPQ